MPSRLHPISPADLYRKTFDRKKFTVVVGKTYYEPRYFNNPEVSLRKGRMVVYVTAKPQECSIGIITDIVTTDCYTVVKIPQQHLRESASKASLRMTIHSSDVYAYLETIQVKKKPSGKRLYRLWSKVYRHNKWTETTIDVSENVHDLVQRRNQNQGEVDMRMIDGVSYHVSEVLER